MSEGGNGGRLGWDDNPIGQPTANLDTNDPNCPHSSHTVEISKEFQQQLMKAFLAETLQSVPLPTELELSDKLMVWSHVLYLQISSPATTTTYGFV